MSEMTDERRAALLNGKLRALGVEAPHGAARAISRCFDCMGIAEDEIRRELERLRYVVGGSGPAADPRLARRRVWGAFKVCAPGDLLMLADDVYRHHLRELIARAAKGEDARPGTKAEVLQAISSMTLHSRLDRTVEALALTIAEEIFPGRGLADGAKEDYAGEMAEKLAHFRRKLVREDRVLTPDEELRDPPAWAGD